MGNAKGPEIQVFREKRLSAKKEEIFRVERPENSNIRAKISKKACNLTFSGQKFSTQTDLKITFSGQKRLKN